MADHAYDPQRLPTPFAPSQRISTYQIRERIMEEFRYRAIMAKPCPTLRELADATGLATSSSVHPHLAALVEEGRLVQHHATGSRTILLPPRPEPCGECGRR